MSSLSYARQRRRDVRLASGKKVDAVIVDDHGQPIDLLAKAQVLNVSAGGLALIADQPAKVGTKINVIVLDDHEGPDTQHPIRLTTLSCTARPGSRYQVRCRLAHGIMPAELVHGWTSRHAV